MDRGAGSRSEVGLDVDIEVNEVLGGDQSGAVLICWRFGAVVQLMFFMFFMLT